MRRGLPAVLASLALISCGDAEQRTVAEQPTATPGKVAATAGRIGEATAAEAGRETRRLSGGGRPNPAAPPRPRGGVGVGAGTDCEQVDADPTEANLGTVTATTLCLINAERVSRGMGSLRVNPDLDLAAARHAADMVRRRYFAHESPDGTDVVSRVKETGYLRGASAWTVGENLAWGSGALGRPGAIVNAWMNSPGHRANILQPKFEEIGFGIVLGNPVAAEGATYVNAFGTAKRAAPAEPDADADADADAGTQVAPAPATPAAPSSTRRARAGKARRCAKLRRASARTRCRARARAGRRR